VPTATVAAIRTPPPTPDASPGCRQVLRNGDFEAGPVDWALRSSRVGADSDDITRAIGPGTAFSPGVRAASGLWLARLGGGPAVEEHLLSVDFRSLLPPGGHVGSARLSFEAAVLGAASNGVDEDWLAATLVNGDGTDAVMIPIAVSDETESPGAWRQFGPLDVTRWIVERDDWPTMALRFVTISNGDGQDTYFFVDAVTLEICAASTETMEPDGTNQFGAPHGGWSYVEAPGSLEPAGPARWRGR
jgi:hypothetical protein